MNVKNPLLLDSNLNVNRALRPLSGGLSESIEPLNTANLTLLSSDAVNLRDWIKIYTPTGSAIYRVVSISNDAVQKTQEIELEHGITILGDTVIPETSTASTDSSTSEVTTTDFTIAGTMTYVLGQLLSYQTAYVAGVQPWVVGTVELSEGVEVKIDFTVLLSAITEIMDDYPDYYLDFDQSVFPWRLNVLRKSQTVTAEGRLSRNVSSAVIQYSDSNLCTRVISETLTNRHLDSTNVSLYGIVSQHLDLGSMDDIRLRDGETSTPAREAEIAANKAKIQASAQRHLDNYDEPELSIDIDAVDLSAITGESLDAFTIGKLFRLAIPEQGIVMNERIIQINYGDLYAEKGKVNITLGNKVADLAYSGKNSKLESTTVSGANSTASKAYKSSSTTAKENSEGKWELIRHKTISTEIEDRLYSAGIVVDPVDGVWLFAKESGSLGEKLASDFRVTSQGISALNTRVDAVTGLMQSAGLEINAQTGVWAFATDETTGLGSHFKVQSDKISMVVETAQDGTNSIKAGQIVLAINNQTGASTAKINATKVEVGSGQNVEDLDTIITTESGKIALVVSTDSQGRSAINPAAIVASINDQSGASQVRINADQIVIVGASGSEGLTSKLSVMQDSIESKVDDGTYQSYITQTANQISSKVSKGSVVSEINQTAEAVTISASKIDLDGMVGVNGLLKTKAVYAQSLRTVNNLYAGTNLIAPYIYIGNDTETGISVNSGIRDITLTPPSGSSNEYTLTKTLYNGSTLTVGTFSRATTLSGTWSGGTLAISASPQGVSRSTTLVSAIPSSDLTWSGNTVTFPIKATVGDSETIISTGRSYTIDFSSHTSTTLSGTWNNGTMYVVASPQGNTRSTTLVSAIPSSDLSWSGYTVSFPVKATVGDSETIISTGRYYTIDFSGHAGTTLAGTWSNGQFTVNASPQGNSIRAQIMDVGSNDISISGNTISVYLYANLNGGETRYYTGKQLSINAQSIFDSGYSSGYKNGQDDITDQLTGVWAWKQSQMSMFRSNKVALAYYDDTNDRYVSAGYHYWYYTDDSTTHYLYEWN